ncbi:MAG: acylphosphatase [Peptoniphilaceae bacterium]|nr:acylphosphatase [Peptoniphilaceae bacterium]MDD7383687.1 acylphosphatase [Peptoniphilaceae bacterium]MDY3738784.1 acylphosphatase [Peptoniphilaceae bacterium]
MNRYKFIFIGRVQGVGFRYRSYLIANKLNLTGFVRNLNNGNVEVQLQGEKINIENFINKIKNQKYIDIKDILIEEKEVIKENSFIIKN